MEMKNIPLGRKCLALIEKKFKGDLTTDQFYLNLMELHAEFPFEGRTPALTKTMIMNRRGSVVIMNDDSVDVQYHMDLQPKNFAEAAQMYAFNRERMNEFEKERPALSSGSEGDSDEIRF